MDVLADVLHSKKVASEEQLQLDEYLEANAMDVHIFTAKKVVLPTKPKTTVTRNKNKKPSPKQSAADHGADEHDDNSSPEDITSEQPTTSTTHETSGIDLFIIKTIIFNYVLLNLIC